jgi:O-methyltransferase
MDAGSTETRERPRQSGAMSVPLPPRWKTIARAARRLLGTRRRDAEAMPPDFSPEAIATVKTVRAFTMTSVERLGALIGAVEYVVRAGVPGDIVECGVWKGGSMMAVALTLLRLQRADRTLHLFDTFDGMPPALDVDRDLRGDSAAAMLAAHDRDTSLVWAYAPLDEVRRNLASTRYPAPLVRCIAGRVEETIPSKAPTAISLLRLDTDWYESTKHEMEHLFPRLSPGGVLIIDDYGHWEGARKAVDEYLETAKINLLLCRIDYTGRIAIKQG